MKNLAGLEVRYLVKELGCLVNGKVDKIYAVSNKDLIFQFHVPNSGKRLLRVLVPNFIYLMKSKPEVKEPGGFCMCLRKNLGGSRLRKIEQKKSERVVEFGFEKKEGKVSLFIELFSKGNIILVKDGVILTCAENQIWKGRVVKAKEKYVYPEREVDFLKVNEKGLKDLLKRSEKESLVKALAIDLGLGGVYAEELCLLAGVEKNEKPKEVKKVDLLSNSLKKIKNKKIDARIIYSDREVKDIVPFELEFYKGFEQKKFKSFSEALEHGVVEKVVPSNKEIEKVERMIAEQKKRIKEMEKGEIEERAKGELIYEKYGAVKDVLKEVGKASEKLGWKEVKKRIKGHKVIKEINAKDKKVIVEL